MGSLEPVVLALELHLVLFRKASKPPSSQNCSPPEVTQLPLKVASMPPLATWSQMIGDGTCTTQSKDLIGWAIKMLFITWPGKPLMLLCARQNRTFTSSHSLWSEFEI